MSMYALLAALGGLGAPAEADPVGTAMAATKTILLDIVNIELTTKITGGLTPGDEADLFDVVLYDTSPHIAGWLLDGFRKVRVSAGDGSLGYTYSPTALRYLDRLIALGEDHVSYCPAHKDPTDPRARLSDGFVEAFGKYAEMQEEANQINIEQDHGVLLAEMLPNVRKNAIRVREWRASGLGGGNHSGAAPFSAAVPAGLPPELAELLKEIEEIGGEIDGAPPARDFIDGMPNGDDYAGHYGLPDGFDPNADGPITEGEIENGDAFPVDEGAEWDRANTPDPEVREAIHDLENAIGEDIDGDGVIGHTSDESDDPTENNADEMNLPTDGDAGAPPWKV